VEEQKVTASEMGTPSFLNAQAMAVDGGLVVVGAPFEDGAAPSSGAAYVLRRLAGTWVAEQRILLSGNEEPNQFYASSVDVRGQRIAIAHNRIPAVDYFHYSGSEWVKRTTVEATPTGVPPAPDGNFFGNMMALDAQHLAFGWPHGDGVAPSSGVIYSVDVKECFSIPAISGSGIIVLAVGTMIVGAAVLRRPGVWTPRSR
jgi:hypothetical protein